MTLCDAFSYLALPLPHLPTLAGNVLVASDLTVRISDFGLSRLREDSPQNYGVTKSNIGPLVFIPLA